MPPSPSILQICWPCRSHSSPAIESGGAPSTHAQRPLTSTRRLEQRISEHQDACRKGEEKKSEVAEHTWKEHHPIRCQETSMIGGASIFGGLRVKEELHIHLTPEDQ